MTNNHLILEPQLLLSENELHPGKVLKPMLDVVWQAMGINGTTQVDKAGNLASF